MLSGIIKDIVCPQCGGPQQYKLTGNIYATQQPAWKRKILEEGIFDWKCKKCGYFAEMAYPLVFVDDEKKYAIYLNPVGGSKKLGKNNALNGFLKRTVKSLAEMKERILIFDAGLDDVAVELVKFALISILKQSYEVEKIQAHFSRVTQEQLEFAVFLPGKNDPVYHSTKQEVYDQSLEIRKVLEYREPDSFITVDRNLAKLMIEEYSKLT